MCVCVYVYVYIYIYIYVYVHTCQTTQDDIQIETYNYVLFWNVVSILEPVLKY